MTWSRPVNVQAHNEEVAGLWDAFWRGENRRVPIVFATDEYLWLGLTGHSFREFYTDARVQLRVLLEGDAWFRENVVHDRPMGPPDDYWRVAPRFWMDEPEAFGCEIAIQEDDFAWSMPLSGPKADILARIRDLDPVQSVRSSRLWLLYQQLCDQAADMDFRGLPVRVLFPGGGTHGVFTVAGRIRGLEALCVDLLEDPAFADELLGIVTEKTISRIAAWHELAETEGQPPSSDTWGMADDALQVISSGTYQSIVLPHHERIYAAMTTGRRHMHLCGHAQQHFATLYEHLGIRSLDGPGTFVDHGRLLEELPELTISAQADHTALLLGPPSAIQRMMAGMLTPAARRPGRFWVTGFLFRDTPMSHVDAMYGSAVRLGLIGVDEQRGWSRVL